MVSAEFALTCLAAYVALMAEEYLILLEQVIEIIICGSVFYALSRELERLLLGYLLFNVRGKTFHRHSSRQRNRILLPHAFGVVWS
jgi:hypothetical protein